MERKLLASILALLCASACARLRAGEIVVYRCVDARGDVSLQDHACADDVEQQQRRIAVPVDAPPRTAPPAPPSPPAPVGSVAPPRVVVVVVQARPLYECRRADGSSYESETGVPERRWVPLWIVDRGVGPRSSTPSTVGMPRDRLPVVAGSVVAAAGTWIEDACFELPRAEACERRRASLADLDQRRRLAVPSERGSLDREFLGRRETLQRECDRR